MGIAGISFYLHIFSSPYTNRSPGYIHPLAGFVEGRSSLKDIHKPVLKAEVIETLLCPAMSVKGLALWNEIHSFSSNN